MPCQNHPLRDDDLSRCPGCGGSFCPDCSVAIAGALRCGPCKTEWVLDRLSGLPPSFLDLASVSRRFAALFLDNLVLYLPLMAFFFVGVLKLGTAPSSSPPAWMSFAVFLFWPISFVYEGWMLAARGQTLGKMALGLKVVNADGAPLRTGQAWGRAALHRLFLSCISVLDYLPALLTPERTTIHDMAAKTRVVLWRS